jgi:hypothetical protein
MTINFPPNSRYLASPTKVYTAADGSQIVYLARRIVPQPEAFALLHTRVVAQGDRIDNIAAAELGDPEQYWRICDANRAIFPAALTERVGRVLRITLPQGIPANTGATGLT